MFTRSTVCLFVHPVCLIVRTCTHLYVNPYASTFIVCVRLTWPCRNSWGRSRCSHWPKSWPNSHRGDKNKCENNRHLCHPNTRTTSTTRTFPGCDLRSTWQRWQFHVDPHIFHSFSSLGLQWPPVKVTNARCWSLSPIYYGRDEQTQMAFTTLMQKLIHFWSNTKWHLLAYNFQQVIALKI